jgi:hypothetical protein
MLNHDQQKAEQAFTRTSSNIYYYGDLKPEQYKLT